jgi:hypothetical protein
MKYLYSKTVNGKTYLFFRYKGKLTPLPPDQNSAEFRRAYDAARRAARATLTPAIALRPSNGADTINAAIDVYLDSAAFDRLEASTKAQYLRTVAQLRQRLGTGRLADLDSDAVEIHTDQVAKRHGTSIADRHLRLMSKIWQICRKHPQFKLKGQFNPTLNTETHYTVQQRHRPWSREVQDAFMAGAAEHLKLAKLLLHFSAQRGGDCIKMLWTDYDGKGLTVRQQKTDGEVEALPDYYICPKPLREALDAAPRLAPTILVNALGRPYANANVLSHAIKRELVRLGLAKPGERTIVMHGLRKTAAAEVGSLGVGAAGIKAIGGWRTDQEANYYAADHDKRRINALVVDQWDAELERQARQPRLRRVK